MSRTKKELEKLEQGLADSITAVEFAVDSAVTELEHRADSMTQMATPAIILSTSKMRTLKKSNLEVVKLRLVSSSS